MSALPVYFIKSGASLAEKYGPAMTITEQADADAYFAACVAHNLRWREAHHTPGSPDVAEMVERQNLAYFAGYYDPETRARVERLFHCAHPVFGAIAEESVPTPEEALALGLALGKAAKEQP